MNYRTPLRNLFGISDLILKHTHSNPIRGLNPIAAIELLLRHTVQPIVFDVGANDGRTTQEILKHLPGAQIYAFEPFGPYFERLRKLHDHKPNVHLFQATLDDASAAARSNTFAGHRMNSSLRLDDEPLNLMRYTPQMGTVSAQATTVDAFCADHELATIDLLKIDTQGSDLNVLRGTSAMLRENRVRSVLLEIDFRPPGYDGQPSFVDILQFLNAHGFGIFDCCNHVWRDGSSVRFDMCFVKQGSFANDREARR